MVLASDVLRVLFLLSLIVLLFVVVIKFIMMNQGNASVQKGLEGLMVDV